MAYIYKVTNQINGKLYIGETIQTISKRWNRHCYDAKNGVTDHFHTAIRYYGKENFLIEEIELCPTEQRFERESYYIIQYNTLEPNGYNWILYQCGANKECIELFLSKWQEGWSIIKIANHFHVSPKTVGYALKGTGITQEEIYQRRAQSIGINSSKKVIQYTLEGDYIATYPSAIEASRQLQYNNASISKNCAGDLLTYNGFIWQYENDNNIEEVLLQIEKTSKTGKNKKAIQQLDKNGKVLAEFESASAAGRSLGKAHAGIAKAAREGRTAYGYLWKYI